MKKNKKGLRLDARSLVHIKWAGIINASMSSSPLKICRGYLLFRHFSGPVPNLHDQQEILSSFILYHVFLFT